MASRGSNSLPAPSGRGYSGLLLAFVVRIRANSRQRCRASVTTLAVVSVGQNRATGAVCGAVDYFRVADAHRTARGSLESGCIVVYHHVTNVHLRRAQRTLDKE